MIKLKKVLKSKKDDYENAKLAPVNPIIKNPFQANHKFTLLPDEAVYLLSFESEFPMVRNNYYIN